MCGIVGFVARNREITENQLEQLTATLAHRGPDAQGYFFTQTDKQTVGLGHCRLSIIDLSDAANQPFVSQNGRYQIVFNGEIYNYRQLVRQFNLSTRTTSDTEVIVELFDRLGPACVQHFNGMFAFAIYDTQTSNGWLFRDRLGIKPLYYYADDDHFAFGSELKTLAHFVTSTAKS